MTDQNNEVYEETVKLLDKDGLAELMQVLTEAGMQDSVQIGANLMLLGIVQYRSFGVNEDEIMEAARIQISLADLVIEVVTNSGA